jgi:hypothetical protein
LGPRDKIVDLFDKSAKEGLLLNWEADGKSCESDIGRLSHGHSGRSNQGFSLYAAMRKLRNLLVHIDIDIKKSCRILMDNAFLLTIKEMKQASVFLQLILKYCHDVLELLLEFHS